MGAGPTAPRHHGAVPTFSLAIPDEVHFNESATMRSILGLQLPDPDDSSPETPDDLKNSVVSVMNCVRSDVSVICLGR